MVWYAQKADISDPEVIENFAKKVGTMERLSQRSLSASTVWTSATGTENFGTPGKPNFLKICFIRPRFLKGKGIDRGPYWYPGAVKMRCA